MPEAGIETTKNERQAYHIVRAVLSREIALSRVAIRDTKSDCGILLDDNNRKPICRLHFNGSQMQVSLFGENRRHQRHDIDCVSDIHRFEEELLNTVRRYDGKPVTAPAGDSPASAGPSETHRAEPSGVGA